MNTLSADVGARILVVDDYPEAATAIAELLRSSGYVVETAMDGVAALKVVESFHPHCVLLDVGMPGMDGLELARRLRTLHGDDIVLVAVTGLADDALSVAATFAIVDHHLHKPIDFDILARVLPGLRDRG